MSTHNSFLETRRFAEKVLFATGGGSGIAAATARRFAAEGGGVAIVDLSQERAEEVAGGLPRAIGIGCDVSDAAAVSAAVTRAHAELGRIDCVLNAAGHAHFGPFDEYRVEDFDRLLAVHVRGAFNVCQASLPILKRSGGGAIVNIASTAALVAVPQLSGYSAAKGAIISLSRQLALDLVKDGIRVNVIAPGAVWTPMNSGTDDPEVLPSRRPGTSSIQQRYGAPEELASAACFLLSEEASFITGALLAVDGGHTAL
jgi:NAD(P)-dependent dehydrogenase (short-subunit alcohol dehydrogenase family)